MSNSLRRFLEAQNHAFEVAKAELIEGRKQGHWIWYILPQARGLGSSQLSFHYGLRDDQEAADYLAHPVLGPRYEACIVAIHGWVVQKGLSPSSLMGSDINTQKLASSVEIFSRVALPDSPLAAKLKELSRALSAQA